MMAPVLDELKEEYQGKLTVTFIDVWKDPGTGRKYGIRAIPTQIFLDPQGNELFRHEGFYSKKDILSKWRELGFNLEVSG
jgi:thioredoxin 1